MAGNADVADERDTGTGYMVADEFTKAIDAIISAVAVVCDRFFGRNNCLGAADAFAAVQLDNPDMHAVIHPFEPHGAEVVARLFIDAADS